MIGLSLAAIALAILVAISIVWGTLRAGISPMPSSRKAVEEMLALAPVNIPGTVYELGSGWGLLGLRLAKRYPNTPVTGIELSWAPYLISRCVAYLAGRRNLRFVRGDFHTMTLHAPGLVICYLHPEGMATLAPQLAAQLPKGAIVISNTFRMPGWQPQRVSVLKDLYQTHIYRYRLPEALNATGANGGVGTASDELPP